MQTTNCTKATAYSTKPTAHSTMLTVRSTMLTANSTMATARFTKPLLSALKSNTWLFLPLKRLQDAKKTDFSRKVSLFRKISIRKCLQSEVEINESGRSGRLTIADERFELPFFYSVFR